MKNIALILFLIPVFAFGQIDITKRKVTVDTVRARVDSLYLKGPVSMNGYRGVNQYDLDTTLAAAGGNVSSTAGQLAIGGAVANSIVTEDSITWSGGALNVTGDIDVSGEANFGDSLKYNKMDFSVFAREDIRLKSDGGIGLDFRSGTTVGTTSGGIYMQSGRSGVESGGISFYDFHTSGTINLDMAFGEMELWNSLVGGFNFTSGGGLLVTSSLGVGLEYGADYSSGYTVRSLTDKGYVDSIARNTYTAGLGIDLTGDSITIGDPVQSYAGARVIDMKNNEFWIIDNDNWYDWVTFNYDYFQVSQEDRPAGPIVARALFQLDEYTGLYYSIENFVDPKREFVINSSGLSFNGNMTTDQMTVNGITTLGDAMTDTAYVQVLVAEDLFAKTKDHGFYAFEDSAIVPSLTVSTWAHITNSGNNAFTAIQDGEGFTLSGDTVIFSADSIPGADPHIKFDWGIDGHGGANDDFEFRVYNVTQGYGVVRKSLVSGTGANNRVGAGTASYDSSPSYGDRYVLQVQNLSNGNEFTFENASIYMEVSHY